MPPTPAPVPGQFHPFGLDTGHSAFPTVTQLPDGRLRMMWRHGSAHASTDGVIMTSVSSDNGTTWSDPEPVIITGGPTGDVRDPHLSTSGTDVFLTFFVTVSGIPSGARVARSIDGGDTFLPSVRIDPNYPWAAISSPVITVGGKLWTSLYAHQTSDPAEPEHAYAAWSSDNGASWSSTRIAIGLTGNDYQEPWTVAGANGSVVFVMRDGTWANLASRNISANGTWSPIYRNVLTGATGNSASVRASNGRIYTIVRDTVTRAAELASSGDNGITFTTERVLMPRPAGGSSGIGTTYAHPIELADGYLFTPLGMERSNSDSRLYLGYL